MFVRFAGKSHRMMPLNVNHRFLPAATAWKVLAEQVAGVAVEMVPQPRQLAEKALMKIELEPIMTFAAVASSHVTVPIPSKRR